MRTSTLYFRGAATFEESLVESTTMLRSQNRWPALLSASFYAVLALALVSLPVLHPDALTFVVRPLISLLPPPPATPPPPQQVQRVTVSASAPSLPIPAAPMLRPALLHPESALDEAPNLNRTAIMTGPGATSMPGWAPPSEPAVHVSGRSANVGIGADAAPSRAKISTGVSQGLLLTPLHPLYPAIARVARQEGTVVVQALISRSGMIEAAHVLSGPAMLQASALD
ncbi:MAG: energy transducer TonB, partial [Bryocella sp.]